MLLRAVCFGGLCIMAGCSTLERIEDVLLGSVESQVLSVVAVEAQPLDVPPAAGGAVRLVDSVTDLRLSEPVRVTYSGPREGLVDALVQATPWAWMVDTVSVPREGGDDQDTAPSGRESVAGGVLVDLEVAGLRDVARLVRSLGGRVSVRGEVVRVEWLGAPLVTAVLPAPDVDGAVLQDLSDAAGVSCRVWPGGWLGCSGDLEDVIRLERLLAPYRQSTRRWSGVSAEAVDAVVGVVGRQVRRAVVDGGVLVHGSDADLAAVGSWIPRCSEWWVETSEPEALAVEVGRIVGDELCGEVQVGVGSVAGRARSGAVVVERLQARLPVTGWLEVALRRVGGALAGGVDPLAASVDGEAGVSVYGGYVGLSPVTWRDQVSDVVAGDTVIDRVTQQEVTRTRERSVGVVVTVHGVGRAGGWSGLVTVTDGSGGSGRYRDVGCQGRLDRLGGEWRPVCRYTVRGAEGSAGLGSGVSVDARQSYWLVSARWRR